MSMTKEQFFDEIAETIQVTEAQLEEHYYWEMNRRRQLYLDHITKQIMEQPESHWFSPDFEAWMQQQQREQVFKIATETLMAGRKAPTPTTDMEFDIPMDVEDSNTELRNKNLDSNFI